jgi:predicted transcriptional regulator
MNNIKDALLELAQQLPEECTWDEVMYRVFVRQKIDAGLKDADAGRTISHEEVFEERSFTRPAISLTTTPSRDENLAPLA